jgi:hypothetical protein
MMQAYAEQIAAIASAPKGPKTVTTKRVNGQVHAEITDQATGETRHAIFQRGPEGMTGQVQ